MAEDPAMAEDPVMAEDPAMAEESYTPPPFGDEWKRAHMRIRPYREYTTDMWRIRLVGRHGKVLLDFEASYNSRLAHRSFYKDFLSYLLDNLHSVNLAALASDQVGSLSNSLYHLVALCKEPALSLPGHVVEELFNDLDVEERERKRRKEEAEARRKELESVDAQLKELKKKRKTMLSS